MRHGPGGLNAGSDLAARRRHFTLRSERFDTVVRYSRRPLADRVRAQLSTNDSAGAGKREPTNAEHENRNYSFN
jgi:hypothetical protein